MILSPARKKLGFFRFGSEFRDMILKLEYPDEHNNIALRRKNRIRSFEKPSTNLYLGQSVFDDEKRKQLLDAIATVLDDHDPLKAGRHEMCMHFAILLRDTLNKAGYQAKVFWGIVRYYNNDDRSKYFGLHHAWVEVGNEIIDGNADSLINNPIIDPDLCIRPVAFWGIKSHVPEDRAFLSRNLLTPELQLELEIDDELEIYIGPLELALSGQ